MAERNVVADQEILASRPAPPAATGPGEDLSAAIASAVEKRPGDKVQCTRVWGSDYRCNWWAAEATGAYDNPAMGGMMVTTHRVRQSRFLRVRRTGAGELVMDDRSHAAAVDRQRVGPRVPQ